MYLKDKNPNSVQELAELAEHYEQVHTKYRSQKSFGRHPSNGSQFRSYDEHKETLSDYKKKRNDTKRGSGVKCWKCNGFGHVQRECKQALRVDYGKVLKRIKWYH